MSESKIISPLLDGYTLGSAISDHDGVRCYPAIKENSDDKYIIKVISIPASQVQLDALLLTGAYKDPADAVEYFKSVSDGVVEEAEFLFKLGKLDGFLPYEEWQVVPMENGKLGYRVYLRGTYKRSLEKYMRRHPMTHLAAVNLGLDLCAALAICRRAGCIYVDLKPGNIFISKGREYRIGDLGFSKLDSLQYTSLPGKYRSPYTPPEIQDALNTLNETVDTYAVGMILYQIYNNGQMPDTPKEPDEPFPAPVNADYELAEIILKAVAPKQESRWNDPMEMGQALVAYMQRNTVNDTPITPPSGILVAPEAPAEEPAYMDGILEDESVPSEEDTQDGKVSEEVGEIFAEADGLLTHETPDGVVIPEYTESAEPDPVPEMDIPTPEPEEEDDDFDLDDFRFDEEFEEEEIEEDIPEEEVAPIRKRTQRKKIGTRWILPVVLILLLAAMAVGGLWFYQNHYLQTIDDISVSGSQSKLTVTVDTGMDPSLLTVTCTDTYGNTKSQPVVDGQAVFTDLLPGSLYKINLEVSGFHKLVGPTSDIFTTATQTNVVSFTAVTGPEDGSVMLTFTIDGGEPEEWIVLYGAEGEEERNQVFTGHNVTIKGLTVDKTYFFQLSSGTDLELLGQTTLEFTASSLVLAEDLTIASSNGSEMTVRWNTPEDAVVESWNVRCYSDGGHEEVQEVTGNEAVFSGIDHTQSYTVEVTAAEMTQPVRASITANPITVTNLTIEEDNAAQLTVNWDYEGEAPADGWLVMVSYEGSETQQRVIKCDKPSAVITPRVPSANYKIVIQAADGTSIFNNIHEYKCPNAEVLEMQGLSADNITANLLKTPDGSWSFETVGKEAFDDTFSSGEKLSIVFHANDNFYIPEEEISLLYVIRNSEGHVLPQYVMEETGDWCDLWYDGDYHYGELNIPDVPTEAGSYSLSIYINNKAVTVIDFTITE